MAECSAPYENAAETGIYCELPEGHRGDHECSMPIRWRDPDDERTPRGQAVEDVRGMWNAAFGHDP